MSDMMLIGVLQMPPSLWGTDPLDKQQRYQRYLQAAIELELRAKEIERLKAKLQVAEDALDKFTFRER